MGSIKLSRQELYNRIWSVPAIKLSNEFGISDVGLGKICKKYCIPKPPLGYWTKIAHGRPSTQIPLPPAPSQLGENVQIDIIDHPKSSAHPDNYPEVYAEFGAIKTENVSMEIINTTRRLHPLLAESLKYFKSSSPDEYSRLRPGRVSCVDISVSESSLDRALFFMHTLFRFLETQGFVVHLKDRYGMSTFVNVHGVDVQIGISEKVTRSLAKPSKGPKSVFLFERKYDFEPTGILSLTLKNCYCEGIRKNWSDTEKHKLESEIQNVANGILAAGIKLRISDLERKKEDQRLKERRIEAEKEQIRLAEAHAQRQQLMEDAERWRKSQNLRAYIEAMKRMKTDEGEEMAPSEEFQKWLNWATLIAADLDPLQTEQNNE